jgi:hypothetical protein
MTTSTLTPVRAPRGALLVAAVWLGLAILAGATGALIQLPFPGTQVIIFTLLGATIGAALGVPALRVWVDALPLRLLIGINALRLVGISFLVLAARGQLAPAFADRAGWGDIAVAIVALILLAAGDPRTGLHRGIIQVWNAFGVLDLIVAVATATAVTLRGSVPGIAPLLSLPLVVVPTFFVPLFVANHVIVFLRLRAAARAGHGH